MKWMESQQSKVVHKTKSEKLTEVNWTELA